MYFGPANTVKRVAGLAARGDACAGRTTAMHLAGQGVQPALDALAAAARRRVFGMGDRGDGEVLVVGRRPSAPTAEYSLGSLDSALDGDRARCRSSLTEQTSGGQVGRAHVPEAAAHLVRVLPAVEVQGQASPRPARCRGSRPPPPGPAGSGPPRGSASPPPPGRSRPGTPPGRAPGATPSSDPSTGEAKLALGKLVRSGAVSGVLVPMMRQAAGRVVLRSCEEALLLEVHLAQAAAPAGQHEARARRLAARPSPPGRAPPAAAGRAPGGRRSPRRPGCRRARGGVPGVAAGWAGAVAAGLGGGAGGAGGNSFHQATRMPKQMATASSVRFSITWRLQSRGAPCSDASRPSRRGRSCGPRAFRSCRAGTGIQAAPGERVAAQDAPQPQQATPRHPEALDGLLGVVRAGGQIPAARPQQR